MSTMAAAHARRVVLRRSMVGDMFAAQSTSQVEEAGNDKKEDEEQTSRGTG